MPKLVGPYLFQGYATTLRELFNSHLKGMSEEVNKLSETDILEGDVNGLASEIVRVHLANEVVLSPDEPAMLGEAIERMLESSPPRRGTFLKFLMKFDGPRSYFQCPPGTDGPLIAIPATISAEGIILEVMTRTHDVAEIGQLLDSTR